jgi:hypothetical protein
MLMLVTGVSIFTDFNAAYELTICNRHMWHLSLIMVSGWCKICAYETILTL